MPTPTRPTALAPNPPTPAWKTAAEKAVAAVAARSGPRSDRIGEPTDNVSLLPPRGAQKLLALRTEWEELNTLAQADIDQHQDLILSRGQVQDRLATLTDHGASMRGGHSGNTYPEDHPSVVSARSELDGLNAKLEALQTRQKGRKERRDAVGKLLRRVEAYVSEAAGSIEPFDMDPPQLPPGETAANAVERMRQRRRELLSDLKEVAAAPLHSSLAKAKLRKQIDELAERGRPDCYRLIEGGKAALFPKLTDGFPVNGFVQMENAPFISARATVSVPDAVGLIAWLFKDQLTAMLEAEMDASADDANALSAEQRAERTAAISEELLACERLEEAFCELSGNAIIRRGDTDPRAFLSVDGPEPKGSR